MAVRVRRMSKGLPLFPSKADEETEATEVQDTQEGIENVVFDQDENENQITDFTTKRLSVASIGKEARKSSRSDNQSYTTQESDSRIEKPDQTGRQATKVRIDSTDSSCKECKADLMCPGCTHPNMTEDIAKILANMNKESQDDVYQNIVT